MQLSNKENTLPMLLETQALLKRLRSKTRTLDIKTEVDYEFHEKSFIISRKQLLMRTLDTKKGLRLHRPQRLSIPRPSSIQGENAELHQQFISNKEQNCKQRQLLKSLSLQQQELNKLEGHHKQLKHQLFENISHYQKECQQRRCL